MVSINLYLLVFDLLLCVVLGGFIFFSIQYLVSRIQFYRENKCFILSYIKNHKRGNDLPSKLIYKYLSRKEKQNILKERGEK